MMEKLKSIEEKYNFTYPELYKQLCKDGMLYFGKTGPDWIEKEYPKLKNNPPLLLYGEDIEGLDIDDIEDRYLMLKDCEYDPKLSFVPFLHDGSGDSICFYMNGKEGDDIPIAFIPHDDYEFKVLAKNLQDYIFREMLYAVVNVDDDSFIAEDLTDNLDKMYRSHEKYLTPRQQNILKDIYSRELIEYTYIHVRKGHEHDAKFRRKIEAEGLLTMQEYEDILTKEINFSLLNKEILL